MKARKILSILLLICTFASLLPLGAIAAWAEEIGDTEDERTDAMEEIEGGFSDHKIGETQTITDDGYIGIPAELSIYYDSSKGAIKADYWGTPVYRKEFFFML